MSAYRLLRSNKETGPYSAEELIANGFKPYDLVWVVGKSAGWRYVSELPEFASLAPIIEEQPYDRFYKKSVTPTKSSDSISQKNVSPPPQPAEKTLPNTALVFQLQETAHLVASVETIPVPNPVIPTTKPVLVNSVPEPVTSAEPAILVNKAASPIIGKKVHVVFPEGSRTAKPTMQKEIYEKDVKNQPPSIPSPYTTKVSSEKEKPIAAGDKVIEARFSPISANRAFDGSGKAATSAYQNRASFSWPLVAAALIGIGTLLGLGLLIGLSMARDSNDTTPQSSLTRSSNETKKLTPAPILTPVIEQTADIEPIALNGKNQATVTEQKADTRKALSKNIRPSEMGVEDEKYNVKATTLASPKNEPDETQKSIHPSYNKEAENLIEVTTNTYSVGAFGGISNLQCILVNNSTVSFETIEVSVEYLQANKKVYKRETIYFKDVRAGQQLVINAPKSPRGIKVVSKIVKATSAPSGYTSIKS